jgi:hypothetical protein
MDLCLAALSVPFLSLTELGGFAFDVQNTDIKHKNRQKIGLNRDASVHICLLAA